MKINEIKTSTYFFVEHHQLHVIGNAKLLNRKVAMDVGSVYS